MRSRSSHRPAGFACVVCGLAALCPSLAAAQAPATPALVHPVFAAVPEYPGVDDAHRAFAAAVARYRLGPVEVIDVPGTPPPRAPELLRTGREAVAQKRFDQAVADLDAAVAEVVAAGGAGLSTADLAELFLQQGMAVQKADWRDPPAPVVEIAPPKAREAYLRAAQLAPLRELTPRHFPPLAVASWHLAIEEIKKRTRGSLVVLAPSDALISVDGGPLKPGLVPVPDALFGEHFIHVEQPGRQPWAAVVPLGQPSLEVQVPRTAGLTLDDAPPAARARVQGASFALCAELAPGSPNQLHLRLIDARSGLRKDATVLPFPGDMAALDAAVMRLEEQARRASFAERHQTPLQPAAITDVVLAPVTPRPPALITEPRLADDPGAWARSRWPLLAAVGVAVSTAFILGIAVGMDDRPR